MTSHMEGLDIFLHSKGFLKDESFDILNTENWNLDDDKFLESIRYGDKLDEHETEIIEEADPDVDVTDSSEIIDIDSSDIFSYSLTEETLSPCSASSTASSSSPSHSQSSGHFEEHNVKVVQLVGILPPGCKTFQIVHHDDDGTISGEEIMEVTSTGSPSGHHHHTYQELKLSDEEKRLLTKEGVALPSHYPLTKFEERELKRIRRKIRNKISAQDSRKRKKEFLDTLQQRVHEVEEEKSVLNRKVRTLEIANAKLAAHVKRLQMMVTNAAKAAAGAGNTTVSPPNNNVVPAATTLLVLMLSLALVVLPVMQGKKQASMSIDNAVVTAAFDDSNPNTSITGRSRTMMSLDNQSTDDADCWKDLIDMDEPLIKIPRFSFHQPSTLGKAAGTRTQATQIKQGQSHSFIGRKRPNQAVIDEVD